MDTFWELPQSAAAAIETDQTLLLRKALSETPSAEVERLILQVCEAATTPNPRPETKELQMDYDQVDRGDFQLFSTELERSYEEIWNVVPKPKRTAHLAFGNWLMSHERVIHDPVVTVDPTPAQPLTLIKPKLSEQLENLEQYVEQEKPLPPAPPGLDLATQEALFFNDGQDLPHASIKNPVSTFEEVILSSVPENYYTEQDVLDTSEDAFGLQCPMHYFYPPDDEDEWTGAIVQIRSEGMYCFGEDYVWVDPGTYKIRKAQEMYADAKARLYKIAEIEIDPNEIARRRVRRMVKAQIQLNLMPRDRRVRYGLPNTESLAEERARNTLRDMLSEADWRRYVTNGFVMVRGPSSRWYQIFRSERIRVYENNRHTGYLCIHSEDCPPSDHVIAMKILIEFDEDALWAGANYTARNERNAPPTEELSPPRSLLDTLQILKVGM